MSSISGSDSDSEDQDSDGDWPGRDVTAPGADDDEESWAQSGSSRKSSQVVFQNPEGQYLVVHRCILNGKVRAATQRSMVHVERICTNLKFDL